MLLGESVLIPEASGLLTEVSVLLPEASGLLC